MLDNQFLGYLKKPHKLQKWMPLNVMGKLPCRENWKIKKKSRSWSFTCINNRCRGQNSKRKYPEQKPGGLQHVIPSAFPWRFALVRHTYRRINGNDISCCIHLDAFFEKMVQKAKMTSLNLAVAVATNSANCTTALWTWSGTVPFIQTNCRDRKHISYIIRKNSKR